MSVYGANPQELRSLGSRLDDAVVGLGDVQRLLTLQMDRAPWTGADADRFRGRWRGPTRVTFDAATSTLREAAESLRRNALEQERASGLLAGGAGAVDDEALRAYLTLMPADDASRADVEAWWNALSDEQRAEWISDRSDSIGNRDGIPLEDRYAANRRTVEKRIEALERIPGAEEEYERYKNLLSMDPDGDGRPVDILYFDYSKNYVAVVHGDLKTATEVLVTVSGTGSNFDKFVTNFGPEGDMLANSDRAVISTLVWDPPPSVTDNVSLEDYTKSFVNGPINSIISTANSEVGTVSLVGHSSGAVAVQELMVPREPLVVLSEGDVPIREFMVPSEPLVVLSEGDVPVDDFVPPGYSRELSTADMVDSVSLLAPAALNQDLVVAMGDREIFVAMNTDDAIQLVDGNSATWNGLDWKDGDGFPSVVEGTPPWDADNVRWSAKDSGLGNSGSDPFTTLFDQTMIGSTKRAHDDVGQALDAHGNSIYYENYGDDIGMSN